VDHFKKSISSGIKKRKLAIISQSGTVCFDSLPEKNKIANQRFIIRFTIPAKIYPMMIVVATISPSGGWRIICIMTASKKQILQMKATLDRKRIFSMMVWLNEIPDNFHIC